jgi:predicted SAM-dependent methyltransferase
LDLVHGGGRALIENVGSACGSMHFSTIQGLIMISALAKLPGMYRPINALAAWMRPLLGIDQKILQAHRREQSAVRLHLGCGQNHLKGWLNSDMFALDRSILYLNATKEFGLADNSVDFAYCEHMIEHLRYEDARKMVMETYRVLKSGGVFRIVTPELSFLIELYRRPDDSIHQDYITYSSVKNCPYAPEKRAIFVVNNFVRDWGHLFIYDAETLTELLETAGFRNPKRQEINQSDYQDLRELENESRMPPGFLKLESMIIEFVK